MEKQDKKQGSEQPQVAVEEEVLAPAPAKPARSALLFFFAVIAVSAAVSLLVVSQRPEQAPVEESTPKQPYLTWFLGDKAPLPFEEQWKKSRILSFEQLVDFGELIADQIDEESAPGYEAIQSVTERRRTLMKTYFGDNEIIGVEIDYPRFKSAAQLVDAGQFVIPISEQPRDLADGGLADYSFTFALKVDPAMIREHLFVKPRAGQDTAPLESQNVRLLFTPTDVGSEGSASMVRPLKVASRRKDPLVTTRNEWVRYRTYRSNLFADLEGAMLGDGSGGHAMIKGFVYR